MGGRTGSYRSNIGTMAYGYELVPRLTREMAHYVIELIRLFHTSCKLVYQLKIARLSLILKYCKVKSTVFKR